MKKSWFGGIAIGFVLGAIAVAAVPVYGAVKQYMLTEVAYPIVVNGVAYTDPSRPILNYEGSTYVPLAKLGDLTGVNYTWNEQLRQVEIQTPVGTPPPTPQQSAGAQQPGSSIVTGPAPDVPALPHGGISLFPDTVIEEAPEPPGYNGVADTEDVNVWIAEAEGSPQPPLLSEGWVSEYLTWRVFGISAFMPDGNVLRLDRNYVVVLTLEFPDGWFELDYGETTVSGIRIKRHMGYNYYNIADFEKALEL